MSLIRQIRLLLLGAVLLMLLGGAGLHLAGLRDALQNQLQRQNDDSARTLGLALLANQNLSEGTAQRLLASAFDSGIYRELLLRGAGQRVVFQRSAEDTPREAPAWFSHLLPLDVRPGRTNIGEGEGRPVLLQVAAITALAQDELWREAVRLLAWTVLLAVAAALLTHAMVGRIRTPLDATVGQANALAEGRYVTLDEPRVPELARLVGAMNAMVQRVRALFEAQSAQLEALRREAHCDHLTGLLHRDHFLQRLNSGLQRDGGLDGGALVLVRVADLAGMNLLLGRDSVDRVLVLLARTLQTYPDHVPDCFAGRLNGSDFALCVPARSLALDTAQALSAALRAALHAFASGIKVHLGAVELLPGAQLHDVLAGADLALANAESAGPFEVGAVDAAVPQPWARGGEQAWRQQLLQALQQGQVELGAYPVVDRRGQLVHLESPLRLRLAEGEAPVPAARWLPLAGRNRMTALLDTRALSLALQSIAHDGRPRAISIAGASLADGGFAPHVLQLVQEQPRLARLLWVEVDEAAAIGQFQAVQEFGRMLRPLGVRFGLEHAGERLHAIDRLFELGLDYVKLDAALCTGVGAGNGARELVKRTAALLHALSLQVHAEGVATAADAEALWACGIDAVTGPWASGQRP